VKNAITRLAGANRYETASIISKKMNPKTSGTVIIATGLTFHDAMVAVPLASAYKAPLLLATEKHITAQTEAELKRLGAKNVIVVSTNGAIGDKAKAEFKAAKYNMTYIEGKTCFETAAKVAKALQTKTKKAPTTIFFATDSAFADALSASPVAAIKNAPIMYLKNTGSIDSATANYLKSVKGKVKNAYIIGGDGVISDAMMKNVANALGLTVNKTVQRVAGKNRYVTCTEVNSKFKDILTGSGVCIAKGQDFPDALAGGVFAAKLKAPLFLADNTLIDEQKAYLKDKKADTFYVFGGTGAVPDDLVKLIAKASV
jgi:putative cell wall-binding protein